MAERKPGYEVLSAGALDLRPGPGGQSWNIDLPGDREKAIRLVAFRKPFLLIGTPPGARWCGLNVHANNPRVGEQEVARRVSTAKTRL
eukprot:14362876-Alexandrium_andersonii.AAC.1